jgi:segregation and condensation protein A
VVVTFLALLELIRLKQIVAVQSEQFGEIELEKAPPIPVPAEFAQPESTTVS